VRRKGGRRRFSAPAHEPSEDPQRSFKQGGGDSPRPAGSSALRIGGGTWRGGWSKEIGNYDHAWVETDSARGRAARHGIVALQLRARRTRRSRGYFRGDGGPSPSRTATVRKPALSRGRSTRPRRTVLRHPAPRGAAARPVVSFFGRGAGPTLDNDSDLPPLEARCSTVFPRDNPRPRKDGRRRTVSETSSSGFLCDGVSGTTPARRTLSRRSRDRLDTLERTRGLRSIRDEDSRPRPVARVSPRPARVGRKDTFITRARATIQRKTVVARMDVRENEKTPRRACPPAGEARRKP